jgi:hypothetical protein
VAIAEDSTGHQNPKGELESEVSNQEMIVPESFSSEPSTEITTEVIKGELESEVSNQEMKVPESLSTGPSTGITTEVINLESTDVEIVEEESTKPGLTAGTC